MSIQRTALVLTGFAAIAMPVSAAVLNVPGTYPTIQAGINAANPGDTVLVANGTYSGAGNYNIDTLGKAITVQSAGGPTLCVIDVGGSGDGFDIQTGETAATVIDGFGFINISGTMFNINACDPTISNCKGEGSVLKNSAAVFTNVDCGSSGIWIKGGAPTFTGCGSSGKYGLHSLNAGVTLVNCTFSNNLERGVTIVNGVLNAAGCQINGNADYNTGGGVVLTASGAAFTNCDISNNVETSLLDNGGGIAMFGSTMTVANCTIKNNLTADDTYSNVSVYGGGVYIDAGSAATFVGTLIQGNSAEEAQDSDGGYGGGVYAVGPATYTNCTIKQNHADTGGGGIWANATQALTGCLIAGNRAEFGGGGLDITSGASTVTSCVLDGNSAAQVGWGGRGGGANAGGAWFDRCWFKGNVVNGENYVGPNEGGGGAFSGGGSTFVNCVFSGNKDTSDGNGGALNVTNTDTVVDCTFYGNSALGNPGQALYARVSGGYIGSDIFWGNGANPVVGASLLSYCDVEGGYTGPGNINADPKFLNAAINDFRLKNISPCIDAGNNLLIPGGVTKDYLSSPRRLDDPSTVDTGAGSIPIVDMGAYEYVPPTNPCPWGPYNPNKAAPGDHFGSAVDVSGDAMVVGAFLNDGQGEDAGAAYVLKADGQGGWTPAGDLIAPDTQAGDFFGISASIDGDVIAVGAPRNDAQGSNAGAVHIFRHQDGAAWAYETTLLAPDGAPGSQFGFSVAVSGDTVLVGAWKASHDGVAGTGQAYVYQYRESNWEFVTTLTSPDAHQGDAFGWSVHLSGDVAAVGAPGAFDDTGEAYLFRRAGEAWFVEAVLETADGSPGDRFGHVVAIGHDYDEAIVGAPGHDAPGMMDSGAAYLFNGSLGEWTHEATLTGSVASEGANAGFSVSLQGTRAAVGAPGAKGAAGAAAIFDLGVDQWEEGAVLVADDAAPGDAFGGALALDGASLGVGARLHDGPIGQDIGSVYVLSLIPCNPPQCYADFNADDALDLFDFLGYVNAFNAGEDRADCTQDGSRDLFDFLCYVNAFNVGC